MNPQEDSACDCRVAGPLVAARTGLRRLLVEESESLVTVLGHVEFALERSVDPTQTDTVRQHCRQALRLVDVIEARHDRGHLPDEVTACLAEVRRDMREVLARLEVKRRRVPAPTER